MDPTRRTLLGAAAVLLLPAASRPSDAAADPFPPLPRTRTPGRPGDFDFLSGEWRIRNRRRTGADAWDEFEGEATVHRILNGAGSVEDLRIPARGFAGLGLRLLEVGTGVWSDFWVNAKDGVLATPGQAGSFENGVGIFASEDVEDGHPVTYVGVWDRIAPDACRWRQASTRDGGATWRADWLMDWSRVR